MLDSLPAVVERLLFGPDSAPVTTVEPHVIRPISGALGSHDWSETAHTSIRTGIDEAGPKKQHAIFAHAKKAEGCITPISPSNTISSERGNHLTEEPHQPHHEWRPTLLHPRPIVGFAALCVAITCVFGSLAVLKVSNESPVDRWPIQPTVYLAIVTAISNSAIALVWMEAQPVSWWYSAARGRSIASLERQYHITRSLVQSIRWLKKASLLNFACICAALVVVDGPLLQRASSVGRASQPVNIPLTLRLSPELPTGYTGRSNGSLIEPTDTYASMMRAYLSGEPVVLDVLGCPDKCHAKVLGPGVAPFSCQIETQTISRAMMRSSNATWGYAGQKTKYGANMWQLPALFINISPTDYEQADNSHRMEAAQTMVGRLIFLEDDARYITRYCKLAPAVFTYDIVIEDRKVTLPQHANEGVFVDWANNTRIPFSDAGMQVQTMFGLLFDISIFFTTEATVVHHMEAEGELWAKNTGSSTLAFRYEHDVGYWMNAEYFYYSDPTDDITAAFNKYMLRAGALASSWSNVSELIDSGLDVNQSVLGRTHPLVYKSDLSWFAGAAALQIGTVLLILPMFYGWWKQGISLSLSPLTLALAFDSPLVKDVASASGARGVVHQLGNIRVKFGVVMLADEQGKRAGRNRLGIAKIQDVEEPMAGERFDS